MFLLQQSLLRALYICWFCPPPRRVEPYHWFLWASITQKRLWILLSSCEPEMTAAVLHYWRSQERHHLNSEDMGRCQCPEVHSDEETEYQRQKMSPSLVYCIARSNACFYLIYTRVSSRNHQNLTRVLHLQRQGLKAVPKVHASSIAGKKCSWSPGCIR